MEPVSALLAAIGLAMNASGQAAGSSAAAQNLQFQKEQGRKQERLSEATRTDALGNKQYYDPATNSWKTELTPMQSAITKAGETEQLRSLTEDAQRNRQLRERQQVRSEQAAAPYNEAVQHYIHDRPRSEGAINDELQTLMLQANQDKGKEGQAILTRQAARLGRGGDIPGIVKATDDRLGSTMSDAILKARQGAMTEHASRVQQHDQTFLPEIAQWAKLIDDGGGSASQRFSNVPEQLNAIQGQQQSGMLSAIQAANSGVNNASRNLVTAEQKTIDFNPLIKALAANKLKTNKTDDTTNPDTSYDGISKYINAERENYF